MVYQRFDKPRRFTPSTCSVVKGHRKGEDFDGFNIAVVEN